jgi:hypothetical protein
MYIEYKEHMMNTQFQKKYLIFQLGRSKR